MLDWNLEDRALWARLEAFDMDLSGASLPFSARLSRDNDWDEGFATRVVAEYKRFVFLAMRAGHPVTPSDEIDQAWHLHLCYTRSYWDEMCADVLGAPLHHGPTRGGRAEGQKFADWYGKTLQSYREWFGEEPPRDLWPPSEVRFGEAAQFRRVNLRRVWVIAKPQWLSVAAPKFRLPQVGLPQVGLPRRDWIRLLPLLWVWMLTGCAELQTAGPNVFNWHGAAFLQWFWTLSVLGLALGFWRKNASLLPDDANFPTEPLDAAHLAHLRDPQNGAVDVTLAMLHQKGALEVTPAGTLRATGAALPLSPFEQVVLARCVGPALSTGEPAPSEAAPGEPVRLVRAGLKTEAARLEGKLQNLGLVVSRETQRNADNWPIGITLGLLAIGLTKIGIGVSRDRPVGFLVLSCAILSGFLVYFLCCTARRSRRGEKYLAHLNLNQRKLALPNLGDIDTDADIDALAMHMALIGTAAYPPEVQRAMRPPSDGGSGGEYAMSGDSGGDGGGGGDSGGDSGGGGDGGGGCGGCGGGGD